MAWKKTENELHMFKNGDPEYIKNWKARRAEIARWFVIINMLVN